jgi:hypothetical protein
MIKKITETASNCNLPGFSSIQSKNCLGMERSLTVPFGIFIIACAALRAKPVRQSVVEKILLT